MNSPKAFLRARHQTKVNKLAAEVIRVQDAMAGSAPRNPEVTNITIGTYRKMLRDSEVGSCLTLKKLLMIPVLRVVPPDGDEKSKRAAEFIIENEKRMKGSPISVYRNQVLHESLVGGMSVSEANFRKTDISGFGNARCLHDITVGNTEDFTGRTVLDKFGKIEKFVQSRNGEHDLLPSEVLYYGYNTISGSPDGVPALFPAHDPWKLKLIVFRNLAVFINTNASGISKIKIPRDFYKEEKDDGLALLREMAETARIAMPADWELGFDIPPGHAGIHFVKILQEVCNKGIRKAILYDETITAESLHSWKAGTDETNLNLVIEAMKAEGEEFAESFIQEQLYRKILDVNDMQDYPTPFAVTGYAMRKKDPAVVLSALGKAKTDGILDKISLPAEAQAQVVVEMMDSMGVVVEASQIEGVDSGTEETEEFERAIMERHTQDTVQITGIWDDNYADLVEALSVSLSKVYNSGNYGAIREAIEKTITTGGGKFRKGLVGLAPEGLQHDEETSNSAYLQLKRGYGYLTEQIFLSLVSSYKGGSDCDTALAAVATRLKAEKAEFVSMILKGGSV